MAGDIKMMAETAMAFTPLEHALMAIHGETMRAGEHEERMRNATLLLLARQTAAAEQQANMMKQLAIMYAHDHDFELEDE